MSDLAPAPTSTAVGHQPVATLTDLEIRVSDGPVLLPATSAQIHAGQVTALMGASGSGKTTLLRALIGHLPPGTTVTGFLDLLGRAPYQLSAEELRTLRRTTVAYVGQDPGSALNPRMTARRLVAELATDPSEETVMGLLAECRLPTDTGIAGRRPSALSGGQQRRVALARALARAPEVLLLDEPTAGLDATVRDEIAHLLRHLAAVRNLAVVIATHDPHLVRICADHTIRLTPNAPPGTVTRAVEHAAPVTGEDTVPDADALTVHVPDAFFPGGRRRRPVLSDVAFSAARGAATAIIGPSGSGKTTLLRVMAGLHATHTGHLTLDGRPLAARVQRRTREQQRRVQLVPQNPLAALNPRHTIGRQLTRPLRLHAGQARLRPERVAELLAQVDLPAHYADRIPAELSGGQRQRVSIARALATAPDILLCDEVTSALDDETAASVMELLTRLRAEHRMTLIIVSHQHHLVARHTDTVHLIEDGRITESGATAALLERFNGETSPVEG
ncbi:ABC transporter ATP-binding protein [Streptomyces sp. NBC_01423]|uniref:ABC transporter ATP-binding protein n=1 Tax=Streptomyces sp. NBC_01423 TaxID=2903860 RepID=UPI002E2DC9BF|nr:ATP-binding cassette domain-containing protein [Streptomyces sp. NBC_01423]